MEPGKFLGTLSAPLVQSALASSGGHVWRVVRRGPGDSRWLVLESRAHVLQERTYSFLPRTPNGNFEAEQEQLVLATVLGPS